MEKKTSRKAMKSEKNLYEEVKIITDPYKYV